VKVRDTVSIIRHICAERILGILFYKRLKLLHAFWSGGAILGMVGLLHLAAKVCQSRLTVHLELKHVLGRC